MTDENMVGLSPQNIALEKIRPLPGLEEDKQPDKAYGSLVSSICRADGSNFPNTSINRMIKNPSIFCEVHSCT